MMSQHGEMVSKLRDIHLPEPASMFPFTPAWWVIIGLALLIVVAAAYYFTYHRKRHYRSAIKKLKEIEKRFDQDGESGHCMMEIGLLLKQYAIVQFPQSHPAPLWGEAWLNFLQASSKSDLFIGEQGEAIVDWPYQKTPAADHLKPLIASVRHWLHENPHRSYRKVGA